LILSINEESNLIPKRVDSGSSRIEYNAITWVGSSLSRTELGGIITKQDKPGSTHVPAPNRVDLGLSQIESSGIIPKQDKPVSIHVPARNGVGLGSPQIESSGKITKRDKPVSTRSFCKGMDKTLIGQAPRPEQIEVLSDEI